VGFSLGGKKAQFREEVDPKAGKHLSKKVSQLVGFGHWTWGGGTLSSRLEEIGEP